MKFAVVSKVRKLIIFYPARTIELKENTVIVVLGASGDLAKKKTVRNLPQHVICSANLCNNSFPHFLA